LTLHVLSLAYAWTDQPEKAVERCDHMMALAPGAVQARLQVGATYAKVGKTNEARKILEEAEKAWKPDGRSSFFIAAVRACFGENGEALDWLERSFQEHTGYMVYLKFFPVFENLRDDPRFDNLVKRIGIPD
jgi:hypothetical protein